MISLEHVELRLFHRENQENLEFNTEGLKLKQLRGKAKTTTGIGEIVDTRREILVAEIQNKLIAVR